MIRRLLYGTVAGLSCAALCYPQYTVDVSSQFGDGLRDRWDEFRLEELKNGNWPFVKGKFSFRYNPLWKTKLVLLEEERNLFV